MKNEIDLLEEKRKLTKLRIASYKQRVACYYNSKVKVKRFQLGDIIFRKVLQNTQEVGVGALGPNWQVPYKIVKFLQPRTYQLKRMDDAELPKAWNTEHLQKYYQ